MIEIITTVSSIDQAEKLLNIGVDTLYIGEQKYGLRLPTSFSLKEIEEITRMAHNCNKTVCVAVNALMHNEEIEEVQSYLKFLEGIAVDLISVGDPGVIQLLKKLNIDLPFIYDAQTLVTSANQINFWAKKGAVGAVLARELTYEELRDIKKQVTVPIEVLVYGPTCIHHSKRPLIQNYFNFTKQQKDSLKENTLYLSEAKRPETHYSIYEDIHGTHVFATNDINLLPYVDKLFNINMNHWKLDGLFMPEENFIKVTELYMKAKQVLIENRWCTSIMEDFNKKLHEIHPVHDRGLDTGFFLKDPKEIK